MTKIERRQIRQYQLSWNQKIFAGRICIGMPTLLDFQLNSDLKIVTWPVLILRGYRRGPDNFGRSNEKLRQTQARNSK